MKVDPGSKTVRDRDRLQLNMFCPVSAILVAVGMDGCSMNTGLKKAWQCQGFGA